jgi:hypothetical protein
MPWGKSTRLCAAFAGFVIACAPASRAEMGSSYKFVAFSGQSAPGGGVYSTFSTPRIGQDGAVGFVSVLISTSFADLRVYAGQPGALQLIAAVGDPAPGVDGFNFTSFSNVALNSSGLAVFSATAQSEGTLSGLWTTGPKLGLLEGDALGTSLSASVSAIEAPSLNVQGRLAAKVQLSLLSESTSSAVALGQPGKITALLQEGDAAPGFPGGVVISNLYEDDPENDRVDQNDAGMVAFKAHAVPSATPSSFEVLYAGQPGRLKPAAVQKNAAPGIANAIYSGFQADPSLSSDGKLAIVADLAQSDVEGVVVPSRAVFAGVPGALKPIVRDGDTVPGKPGATFTNLAHACVNETGDVVFKADILYPNESTRPSIWVQRIDGNPVLIAASGVMLDTPAGAKEATNVDFAGPGAFNDLHEVVFKANFAANGSGVYIADTRPLIPWLRLTSPRKRRDFVTMDNFIVLKGTAQDATGIAKIEYSVTRSISKKKQGASRRVMRVTTPVKLAKGDKVWSFRVPLAMGLNAVTITATDKLGNVSEPLKVLVLRYACDSK